MLFTDELQKIYNDSKSIDECKNKITSRLSNEVLNVLQKFSTSTNKYEAVMQLKTEIIRLNNQWNYVCKLFNKDDRFDVDWSYDVIKSIIKKSASSYL